MRRAGGSAAGSRSADVDLIKRVEAAKLALRDYSRDMPEYTVELESRGPTSFDERALEVVALHLVDDQEMLGPVASLNLETGVISATLQVEAFNAQHAKSLALTSFTRALTSAGGDANAVPPVEARLAAVESK